MENPHIAAAVTDLTRGSKIHDQPGSFENVRVGLGADIGCANHSL